MEEIEGISLLISKYKDKDGILNILTKNGLYSVLGRGIFNFKSKIFSFSSPFLHAKFEIYKGNVGGYKLKSGTIISSFNDLKIYDYNKAIILDFLSEIILKAKDGIDDFEALFNMTLNLLRNLNKEDSFKILSYFLIKLSFLLGLEVLIKCDDSYKEYYFDYKNGIICNTKTVSSFQISKNDLDFIKCSYIKSEYFELSANYLKIITSFSLLFETQFNFKINSLDLLTKY